jgi:hypothetical protein
MIICPRCQSVNDSFAETCKNCAANLLGQPSFGERVKKNLVWIVFFFIVLAASIYIDLTLDPAEFAFVQICLSSVFLVLLVVILAALLRKYSLAELYESRARRHLTADPSQSRQDFLKAFEMTPPAKRFNALLSYFPLWNQVDPDNAQLALINQIRITPVHERRAMGGKYPKVMAELENKFEVEAYNAQAGGNPLASARKHIYRTYFMESRINSMFQTKATDNALEAAADGFSKGLKQVKFIGEIDEMRKKLISDGTAITLLACDTCKQIVGADHEPKHKKKVYPIYLVQDEMGSVRMAYREKYAPPKK